MPARPTLDPSAGSDDPRPRRDGMRQPRAAPVSLAPSIVRPTNEYLPAGKSCLNFSSGKTSNGGSLDSENSSVSRSRRVAPSSDVEDRAAVGAGHAHRLPRLAVEEDLEPGIAVGRVDLDDHRRLREPRRGGGRGRAGRSADREGTSGRRGDECEKRTLHGTLLSSPDCSHLMKAR